MSKELNLKFLVSFFIFGISSFLLVEKTHAAYKNYFFNSSGNIIHLEDWLKEVQPGDVVLLGENHGIFPHHQNQLEIITRLSKSGVSVDVGFEHLNYTQQEILDNYINDRINDLDYMKAIGWKPSQYPDCQTYFEQSGYEDFMAVLPFDCYKPLIQSTKSTGGRPFAINVPRSLTSKIFRQGISSLTPEELQLLPPTIERGSESYFQRFRELIMGPRILNVLKILNVMKSNVVDSFFLLPKNLEPKTLAAQNARILPASGSHGPITEESLNNMFWAQSVWDEVMSWKSLENSSEKRVFVVIVGDFHAAYADGLAARFKARGSKSVHVVSQIFVKNFDEKQVTELAKPDPKYGARGDLIIITNQ